MKTFLTDFEMSNQDGCNFPSVVSRLIHNTINTMENLVSTLIKYHRGELVGNSLKHARALIVNHPEYLIVLKGIASIESKLGGDQTIEHYLEEKQSMIYQRLFYPYDEP